MTERDDRDARNALVIEEFRRNAGVISSRPDQTILLLGTIGARSRNERTNPVVYLSGEDCLYIFATHGGSPAHPDWYHNLVANPKVIVEVGAERYEAIAETVTGDDRDAIYAKQATLRPNFGEYQEKTTRVIPVVALRKVT
jgi:deazaflavin-dependent oxidoreductase (nitroreductase family)